ncbi:MAG: hypothetical protein OXG24_12505 [Gammaproteobacteria bacterium]|nr:hypothetical protein [Gammaproteobacteria bacterium]
MRLELYFAPESIERKGQLSSMDDRIQRSPLVRLLSYQWPVHLMDEKFNFSELPSEATWLIAYRDRRNRVEFLASNPRTVRMLELLEQPRTSRELAQELVEEFHIESDTLSNQAFKTLESFVQLGIVVLSEELAQQ